MGRLDGEGTLPCSPGSLAQAHSRPWGLLSSATPPQQLLSPHLWNWARICHHRVRGSLGSGHRLPSALRLSGHGPGSIHPGALPSCPHLNISGKPFWLSSSPSPGFWGSHLCHPVSVWPTALGSPMRHLWKHLWIILRKESFSKRGKPVPRKVVREDGVSLDHAHVWPAWNGSCWCLCPRRDTGSGDGFSN